jgi:glycosyltransferase involved in cell wall biosynthesis
MPQLYSAVAASGGVSLVTSRDESFGMSVAESILCGCPVVATNVGAIPEICSDADALRLYELGDVDRAAALTLAAVERGRRSGAEQLRWHEALAQTVSPEQVCTSYRDMAISHLQRRA